MNLVSRLRAHIAQMAPHQKERQGGKLLIEAADEIEKLERLLRDWRRNASPVTQNAQEDAFYERAERAADIVKES